MQLDSVESDRKSDEQVLVKNNDMYVRRILSLFFIAVVAVGTASADLAGDLSNISTVITSVTSWVTSIMAVFMQPPLSIFVGLTIAYGVIGKVNKLMRGRK